MNTSHRVAAAAAIFALGAGGLATALIAPAHASGVPDARATWSCSAADGTSLVGQLLQGTSIQLSMDFDTSSLATPVDPGTAMSSFAFPATLPLGGYVSELQSAGVQSMAVSIGSFPITIGAPTPQTVSTSLISPQTTLDKVADPGLQMASTLTQGAPVAPTTAGSYAVTAPDAFQGDVMLVDPAVTGGSTAPFDAGALSCVNGSGLGLGTLDDGVPSSPPPSSSPTQSPTQSPTVPALPATVVSAQFAKTTIAEGQDARISASVVPASGSDPVAGSVVARIESATMAGPVALKNGTARLDLRDLSAGSYAVTVTYLGSDEYAPSSTVLQLTVAPKSGKR